MERVVGGSGERDSLGLAERLKPSRIAWLNAVIIQRKGSNETLSRNS